MTHVHCGSIIGYIEKRCASAADERRRPSRFCPRYVSALSDARLHEEEWRQGTLGDARSIKPSEGSRSRLRRTRAYANLMRRTGQARVKGEWLVGEEPV